MDRRTIIHLLIFGLAISLLGGCRAADAADVERQVVKPVRTLVAENEITENKLDYVGVVSGQDYTNYASKIPGRVTKIYFEKGDRVESGDLLFEVHDEDIRTAYESAELQVKQSRSVYEKAKEGLDFTKDNYERVQALYQSGAASKVQFDEAKLQFENAQKDANSAGNNSELSKLNAEKLERDLLETKVYAKHSGFVSAVIAEDEDYIDTGHPVMVVRASDVVINMGVASEELGSLHLGDSVDILHGVDYVNTGRGQIAKISNDPNPETRLFDVEVAIDEEDASGMKVGDIVKVHKSAKSYSGAKLPLAAIQNDGEDFVYVVSDGHAEKRPVHIVAHMDQFVIVSGLENSEQIIFEGMRAIDDGDQVNILD